MMMVYIDRFSQTEPSERPSASDGQVPRQALQVAVLRTSRVRRKDTPRWRRLREAAELSTSGISSRSAVSRCT